MGRKMNNTPCYKCENRKAGCHSECETYIVWKAENDAEREKRIKLGNKESIIKNYKIEGFWKSMKKNGRHR